MLKNGRRGSLSGKLTVRGIQGHVAYPHLAKNPVHLLAPALAELARTEWDKGNESFPPTTWQVSNIHAGTGAGVIPGSVTVDFNFRFSTESPDASLKSPVESILKKHGLDYRVEWTLGAKPFLSGNGRLAKTVQEAAKRHTGRSAELSTTGGTSDARFIIDICPEVIELGPVNASIHKLDEHIEIVQLDSCVYLDRCAPSSLKLRAHPRHGQPFAGQAALRPRHRQRARSGVPRAGARARLRRRPSAGGRPAARRSSGPEKHRDASPWPISCTRRGSTAFTFHVDRRVIIRARTSPFSSPASMQSRVASSICARVQAASPSSRRVRSPMRA